METERTVQLNLEQTAALQRRVTDYHNNLSQNQRAVGGLSTLPWDLLPSVHDLRPDESLPAPRANKKHRPDGKFITPRMYAEAKIVLKTFVDCCHRCPSLSTSSRKEISRRLPEMSYICLILKLIGARKFLVGFITRQALDVSLPLQKDDIIAILPDWSKALDFLGEQYRAKPRAIPYQSYIHLEDTEPTPYITRRELGRGGIGFVDEIRDVSTNKIYARKSWLCRPHEISHVEMRLKEEIQILKRIFGHEHVIQLVNTYRRENVFGLVMHPVAKISLGNLTDCKFDDRKWAISVLRKSPGCLTSALAFLHSLKIRHKDVTPRNILICEDNVILTDFGISVDVSEMTSTDTSGVTSRTKAYCSPEVAAFDKRGRSSDIFSLGCVILVILTLIVEDNTVSSRKILSFRPFYQTIDQVQTWIQQRLETMQDNFQTMWLRTCQKFIQEAPDSRPTAQAALETMFSGLATEEFLETSFCMKCLITNDNSDFSQERQRLRVSAEMTQQKVLSARSAQLDDDVVADNIDAEIQLSSSELSDYRVFCHWVETYLDPPSLSMPSEGRESPRQMSIIPDCGIHPQVIQGNLTLIGTEYWTQRKIEKDVYGSIVSFFAVCIPIVDRLRDLRSTDILNLLEDSAKWQAALSVPDSLYTKSDVYEQRKRHGQQRLALTPGARKWLASRTSIWQKFSRLDHTFNPECLLLPDRSIISNFRNDLFLSIESPLLQGSPSDRQSPTDCVLDTFQGFRHPQVLGAACMAWKILQRGYFHLASIKPFNESDEFLKADFVLKSLAREADRIFDGVFLTESGLQAPANMDESSAVRLIGTIRRLAAALDPHRLSKEFTYTLYQNQLSIRNTHRQMRHHMPDPLHISSCWNEYFFSGLCGSLTLRELRYYEVVTDDYKRRRAFLRKETYDDMLTILHKELNSTRVHFGQGKKDETTGYEKLKGIRTRCGQGGLIPTKDGTARWKEPNGIRAHSGQGREDEEVAFKSGESEINRLVEPMPNETKDFSRYRF